MSRPKGSTFTYAVVLLLAVFVGPDFLSGLMETISIVSGAFVPAA